MKAYNHLELRVPQTFMNFFPFDGIRNFITVWKTVSKIFTINII